MSAENKGLEREFRKHKRSPASVIIQGKEEDGLTQATWGLPQSGL